MKNNNTNSGTRHYCLTCQKLRNGTTQIEGTTQYKVFFTFICDTCLIPTDGFYTRGRRRLNLDELI